jgi:16S rRNA (guanine(527)-N(7))-methyltransferase RsmG
VFAELLRRKLGGICDLTDLQVARLEAHYELLVRWNRVLNLTAVRQVEQVVERHYCESVFLARHLPEGPVSVADVGSGAGFPGIPVAIVRADSSVTLIESHGRKAVFLREASRGLVNVRAVCGRAQDVRERFDVVVLRAVKYADVAGALQRLGRSVEILTGEVRSGDLPGFEWEPPIRLPWGDRRYLWIGTGLPASPS